MTPPLESVVKHLLFIPAPEHREALLREGVAGVRPPVASKGCYTGPGLFDKDAWEPAPYRSDIHDQQNQALILVWDGKAVVEGVDRLIRALPNRGARDGRPGLALGYSAFADVILVSRHAKAAGLGTLVEVED